MPTLQKTQDKGSTCSGDRPTCTQCVGKQQRCEYETAPLESHGGAIKRKHDELQAQNSAYKRLYNILAIAPDTQAFSILRRIREGADPESLLRTHTAGVLSKQTRLVPETRFRYDFPMLSTMPRFLDKPANPYIHTELYQKTFGQHQSNSPNHTKSEAYNRPLESFKSIPYHAVELVDPRIGSVKGSMWTSVTSDNALVQDLLRVFFIYEYPGITCFHKDQFLDDMVSGRKRFCSQALVNAILANACHGYDKIRNRADFWDPSNIKYVFAAETKRLLELEREEHKLTSVQATLLLAIDCDRDGTDKVGMAYMSRAVSMANSLGLMSSLTHERDFALRKAKAITAWSLFAWQSLCCYFMAKPPLYKQRPVEILPGWEHAPDYFGDLWVKYPVDHRLWPLHYGLTFLAYASLFTLVNDANVRRFSTSRPSPEPGEDAQYLYSRLTRWYSSLPRPLQGENAVLPSQLKLHMFYHSLVLGAFEPLTSVPYSGSIFVETRLRRDSTDYIAAYAAACLETLLRLYYLRHGASSFDTFILQFWNQMGFRALKESQDLAYLPQDSEERRNVLSTLILCATSMREQGRNYYLSELVYRILRDNMGAENVKRLPVMDDPQAEKLRDQLMKRHAQAEYPVSVVGLAEDVEGWRISRVVDGDGAGSGDEGSVSTG